MWRLREAVGIVTGVSLGGVVAFTGVWAATWPYGHQVHWLVWVAGFILFFLLDAPICIGMCLALARSSKDEEEGTTG